MGGLTRPRFARSRRRLFAAGTALLTAAPLVAIATAQSATAVSPDIVISEVYGGGGNSGATLTNDFIELYNRGSAPVDISTWSVQYGSPGGPTRPRTHQSGPDHPGAL